MKGFVFLSPKFPNKRLLENKKNQKIKYILLILKNRAKKQRAWERGIL